MKGKKNAIEYGVADTDRREGGAKASKRSVRVRGIENMTRKVVKHIYK